MVRLRAGAQVLMAVVFVLLAASVAEAASYNVYNTPLYQNGSVIQGGDSTILGMHVTGNTLYFAGGGHLKGNRPEVNFNQGGSQIYDNGNLHIGTDDDLFLDVKNIWTNGFLKLQGMGISGNVITFAGGGHLNGNYPTIDLHQGNSWIKEDGTLRINTDDLLVLQAPQKVKTTSSLEVGKDATVVNNLTVGGTGSIDGSVKLKNLSTNGVVHALNNEGLLSSSLINNADIDPNAGISFSKLQSLPNDQILIGNAMGVATPVTVSGDATISNTGVLSIGAGRVTNTMLAGSISDDKLLTISAAGKVANSATTATSTNTPNTIVLRDGSGNFVAGTVTADLIGNVTGNVSGTSSNVTGVVAVANGGTGATSLTSHGVVVGNGTNQVNVTGAGTNGQLLLGQTGADPLFATMSGDATINNTGVLSIGSGRVTNTMLAGSISDDKLLTITTAGKVANSATTATTSNAANTIVLRDASGNFNAGTVTANLSGSVTGSLIGTVTGDVTGNLTGNVTGNVTGTASNVTGTVAVPNGGTGLTTITPHAIVLGNGASTVNVSNVGTDGQLLIGQTGADPMFVSTSGDVTVDNAGVMTIGAGRVTNTMLAGSISDDKLLTISTAGKVANSATTATDANTADTIVARDASGNFIAGTITAALLGNVTGDLTGNASGTASNVTGVVATANGGTGRNSLTLHGLVVGNAAGTVNVTAAGTDGQVLLGLTGSDPVFTSISGDITINGTGVATIGVGRVTNPMLAGSISDDKLVTIATAGKIANSATTATNANTPSTIVLRDGSGNFSAGVVTADLIGNVTGDLTGNITGTASNVTGVITVGHGGTGQTSLTAHGVVLGNGAGAVNVTGAGTDGQILIAQTGADPAFYSITGDVSLSAGGALTINNNAITTAKIGDGEVTSAKLSLAARTHVVSVIVPDMLAGDIGQYPVFVAPTNGTITAVSYTNSWTVGADVTNNMTVSLYKPATSATIGAYSTDTNTFTAYGPVRLAASSSFTTGQVYTFAKTENGTGADVHGMLVTIEYVTSE